MKESRPSGFLIIKKYYIINCPLITKEGFLNKKYQSISPFEFTPFGGVGFHHITKLIFMLKIYTIILFLILQHGFFLQKTFAQKETKKTEKKTEKNPERPTELNDTIKINEEANALAQVMAGVEIENNKITENATTKQHAKVFAENWEKLENTRLKKLRTWRDNELSNINQNTQNLFYPFSGPDFLNAYILFPNCDNYLLFGLEKSGELPKIEEMKGVFLQNYLANVRSALSEIFSRNYFITRNMMQNVSANLKGVLPILAVFLAKTDNDIIKIQKVFIERGDKLTYTSLKFQSKYNLVNGLYIEFKNKKKNKIQKMYYFGTDFQDKSMVGKPELVQFIKTFENVTTLTKSASYLLHGSDFSTIRNLVLSQSDAVVQDDTGVPFRYFKPAEWESQFYGKYAKPVKDFNYGYQQDVATKFNTDKSIKAIDFTFGYHWWTDKSSVFRYVKKKK